MRRVDSGGVVVGYGSAVGVTGRHIAFAPRYEQLFKQAETVVATEFNPEQHFVTHIRYTKPFVVFNQGAVFVQQFEANTTYLMNHALLFCTLIERKANVFCFEGADIAHC